ncbi:MerR family transcriptional regulator [Dasania marina]|uniref:MerR family transcriptional regulator n=1 Tax=Dasania marina TaxID=471499 RepID=UPI0003798922|nr:MerR family DNA-binding transcriptional regulator [Dasania marina]
MRKVYSITELATAFDISTRSIRFYEEKGLLTPQRQGNNRIYSDADNVKLQLILRGKRLGFSLQESRGIIDLYNPQHGNQQQLERLIIKIREKRTRLKQQQQDIKTMLAELKKSEQQCLASLTHKENVA